MSHSGNKQPRPEVYDQGTETLTKQSLQPDVLPMSDDSKDVISELSTVSTVVMDTRTHVRVRKVILYLNFNRSGFDSESDKPIEVFICMLTWSLH